MPRSARSPRLYYAFGDVDLYAIVDLPDNITAAATLALAVNEAGGATVKRVVLIRRRTWIKRAKSRWRKPFTLKQLVTKVKEAMAA